MSGGKVKQPRTIELENNSYLKSISCSLNNNSTIMAQVVDLLTQLTQKPEIESLDLVSYCDENGITGYTATIYNEETQSTTTLFYDSLRQPTSTNPFGEPCSAKPDYEYKFHEIEKCLLDGTKVLEVVCVPIINGVQESSVTYWVANGSITNTIPDGIGECPTCDTTTPTSLGTLSSWGDLTN
jgi:hypothetical protein